MFSEQFSVITPSKVEVSSVYFRQLVTCPLALDIAETDNVATT